MSNRITDSAGIMKLSWTAVNLSEETVIIFILTIEDRKDAYKKNNVICQK